jgi:hypothetical protein
VSRQAGFGLGDLLLKRQARRSLGQSPAELLHSARRHAAGAPGLLLALLAGSAWAYPACCAATCATELLVATAPQQPTIWLDGMYECWCLGTPEAGELLLEAFFETLIVRDGEIREYIPREDRVVEVVELINAAIGNYEQVAVAGGGFASTEREGFEPLVTNYVAEFG